MNKYFLKTQDIYSAVSQISTVEQIFPWSQESTDAPEQKGELKTRVVAKSDDLCVDKISPSLEAKTWEDMIHFLLFSLRTEMTNYPAS